jgi:hypothetical protein
MLVTALEGDTLDLSSHLDLVHIFSHTTFHLQEKWRQSCSCKSLTSISLVPAASPANDFPFRTGVTGYIAGDALHAIYQEHPDFEYSLLVRSKEKSEQVKKSYPTARIVLGDLDSSSLLEEEAAKADVVLRE